MFWVSTAYRFNTANQLHLRDIPSGAYYYLYICAPKEKKKWLGGWKRSSRHRRSGMGCSVNPKWQDPTKDSWRPSSALRFTHHTHFLRFRRFEWKVFGLACWGISFETLSWLRPRFSNSTESFGHRCRDFCSLLIYWSTVLTNGHFNWLRNRRHDCVHAGIYFRQIKKYLGFNYFWGFEIPQSAVCLLRLSGTIFKWSQ